MWSQYRMCVFIVTASRFGTPFGGLRRAWNEAVQLVVCGPKRVSTSGKLQTEFWSYKKTRTAEIVLYFWEGQRGHRWILRPQRIVTYFLGRLKEPPNCCWERDCNPPLSPSSPSPLPESSPRPLPLPGPSCPWRPPLLPPPETPPSPPPPPPFTQVHSSSWQPSKCGCTRLAGAKSLQNN